MSYADHAALLRAVARLRPAGPLDPALVAALAELIMPAPPLEPQRTAAAPEPARAHLRRSMVVEPTAFALRPGDLRSASSSVPPEHQREHHPAQPVARETALQQLAERADLAAPTQRSQPPLDAAAQRTATEASGPAAPLESLFVAGRVRAILRELATLKTRSGEPDIGAAVALIARAEPIASLPRRLLTSLGHSVQLLFDAGPAMLPFARDKQQLAATATRLLGKDRVRLADFIGDPLQGVRAQRQVRWAPLHWPGRRSAVVVISDLGIGAGSAEMQGAQWRWDPFLAECRQRGLRSVVLIPYAEERWPAAAAGFGTALAWDVASGLQALRRTMRSRAPSLRR